MLTIRLNSPTPITEQIALGLRQLIASGSLAPGDELPTVRQLAADLGINLNTVARAYRLLEADGLVTTIRGRGTKVAAASELRSGSQRQTLDRLRPKLREALTDCKLAELSRHETMALIESILDEFWPCET